MCGSDAEASSTGNARRRARARACVGGDGNGIGCEEGMPREEGKGSDPRQGRGSGYSTSSPGSWRHKDEHLPGTHREVVGDCSAKIRTAKEMSSTCTSLDGSADTEAEAVSVFEEVGAERRVNRRVPGQSRRRRSGFGNGKSPHRWGRGRAGPPEGVLLGELRRRS